MTFDSHASGRPRLVVLTTAGVEPPVNADTIESLADTTYAYADDLPAAIAGADVLLMWDYFSPALKEAWPSADRLSWVHVASAGVDGVLFEALRESSVTMTNARGIYDQPIAEYVAGAVLAHDKRLHESKDLQRTHTWSPRIVARTAGRRALVIGTGGIGRASARLLRALGMNVTGGGRTARESDPDFGRVVPVTDLTAVLGGFDHVVIAAPLTQHNRRMFGAAELAAMKPTAHLVNVGRGELIDEPALITALQTDSIAAATLDVFATEPLPHDSPLWDLDQVAVSPHISGDYTAFRDDLAHQFEDNLRRWVVGQPLVNVVDKALGYVPSSV